MLQPWMVPAEGRLLGWGWMLRPLTVPAEACFLGEQTDVFINSNIGTRFGLEGVERDNFLGVKKGSFPVGWGHGVRCEGS